MRGITQTIDIVEEFVKFVPMKDTCTGADILKIIKWSTEINIDLSKLIGVTTDGAPAMFGQNKSFVTLLHEHIGIDKKVNQTSLHYESGHQNSEFYTGKKTKSLSVLTISKRH